MYGPSSESRNVPIGGGLESFRSRIEKSAQPLLGVVITLGSTTAAQLAAEIFDWVMIDMEHSPMSAATATHLVHAVAASSLGSCLPIVRVPSHGVEWVKWALDSGASGIVVPMVNNAAEMDLIIDRARYPPRGRRSFGPFNAAAGSRIPLPGFPAYYKRAQAQEIAIIPIIESAEGLRNAEEIMRVDGVSAVFIGPYDLRLALGLPGGIDGDEKEFTGALAHICDLGKRLNIPIGCMGVGEVGASRRADDGMRFLLTTVDYQALHQGFEAARLSAHDGAKHKEHGMSGKL